MSVWSTLGQMVQGTLEQALRDDQKSDSKEEVRIFKSLRVNFVINVLLLKSSPEMTNKFIHLYANIIYTRDKQVVKSPKELV